MAVPTSSSRDYLHLPLASAQVDDINEHLETLSPQDILAWAVRRLPNLYQSTAFGLTGLAGTDMLSKLSISQQFIQPDLIFIDTLYHFRETLDLRDEVARKYAVRVHTYKPDGCDTPQELEAKFGEKLWEVSEDIYDWVVKVEPADRANRELGVQALITGRRASQGGERSALRPLELTSNGLLKINPFFAWSFAQVKSYLDEHQVPRNALLAQGYKSVGDWHSTQKIGEGQDERAGRWAGKKKTECGLHVDYFTVKRKAMKAQRESELSSKDQKSNEEPGLSVVSEALSSPRFVEASA